MLTDVDLLEVLDSLTGSLLRAVLLPLSTRQDKQISGL